MTEQSKLPLGHEPVREPELLVELERLVDKHSLAAIFEILGSICHEKARHVRIYWQDDHLALRWEMKGYVIQSLASSAQDLCISLFSENILEV